MDHVPQDVRTRNFESWRREAQAHCSQVKLNKIQNNWLFPDEPEDSKRCWWVNGIEAILEFPQRRNGWRGWYIVGNQSADDKRIGPLGPYPSALEALTVLRLHGNRV
jgi:hypothetical protein